MATKNGKTIAIRVITAILVVGMLVLTGYDLVSAAGIEQRGGPGSTPGRGGQGGWAGQQAGGAVSATPLTDAEEKALQEAILEEYGAMNLYNAAAQQLGEVYPFAQIARSEQQHVNVLVRQAQKYGVEIPANPGLSAAPTFASVASACQAGVAAEIADAALYDELNKVTTHVDILRVYSNLQSASLNNHLPAFQTCD